MEEKKITMISLVRATEKEIVQPEKAFVKVF